MQQKADTSLSCHHNNTNLKIGGSGLGAVTDVGEFERDESNLADSEARPARPGGDERRVRSETHNSLASSFAVLAATGATTPADRWR